MDDQPATQQPAPGLPASAPGIVDRAKAILMQPKAEWARIAGETTEPGKVLFGYALPLIAIGPIATLIGSQVFGYSALFVSWRPSLASSITTAVLSFVVGVLALYVVAFIANFLSPKFGGKDSFPAAFRLCAYAMTAGWVAAIFGIVPALGVLAILGLYSLYLFYLGAGPVMGVPENQTVVYTAAVVVVGIVVNLVLAALVAPIVVGLGMGATSPYAMTDAAQVDMGRSTVDLGELGRVEVDGQTARLTVDGETIELRVEE